MSPSIHSFQNSPEPDNSYTVRSYHYELPEENIAQSPAVERDASRLMVLNCKTNTIDDLHFGNILDFLSSGDLLVVNDTRVFPARLLGKKETGGRVELLLLDYPRILSPAPDCTGKRSGVSWQTASANGLLKSSKRPRPGGRLLFSDTMEGIVDDVLPDGKVKVLLRFKGNLDDVLADHGRIPLPPYISRAAGELPEDRERYQTVYARQTGAVAAPTAGLHFTDTLLAAIRKKGVAVTGITLHVGYGTFAPVRVNDIRDHRIHAEYCIVSRNTAQMINRTSAAGGTIWTVGTTTARVLEYAADENGRVRSLAEWCDLYIYPGYRFKLVKNLITNFHLPGSSLLFMVSALAGRERIMECYRKAISLNYRFYSYGDAMVILT